MSHRVALCEKFVGREKQITLLYNLWRDTRSCSPNVWIFGCPGRQNFWQAFDSLGTGKTSITKEILSTISPQPPVIVDCLECFDAQELFASVLEGLQVKCGRAGGNITKFMLLLQRELRDQETTTYLVFDRAESLVRNLGIQALSTLLQLRELVCGRSTHADEFKDTMQDYLHLHLSDTLPKAVSR